MGPGARSRYRSPILPVRGAPQHSLRSGPDVCWAWALRSPCQAPPFRASGARPSLSRALIRYGSSARRAPSMSALVLAVPGPGALFSVVSAAGVLRTCRSAALSISGSRALYARVPALYISGPSPLCALGAYSVLGPSGLFPGALCIEPRHSPTHPARGPQLRDACHPSPSVA